MFIPEMFKHLNYSNPYFEINRLYKSNKPCFQKSTYFECKRLFTLTDFTLFKRVKLHPYVQKETERLTVTFLSVQVGT